MNRLETLADKADPLHSVSGGPSAKRWPGCERQIASGVRVASMRRPTPAASPPQFWAVSDFLMAGGF